MKVRRVLLFPYNLMPCFFTWLTILLHNNNESWHCIIIHQPSLRAYPLRSQRQRMNYCPRGVAREEDSYEEWANTRKG